MTQYNDPSGNEHSQASQTVFSAANEVVAEQVRLVLALLDIQAAVIRRDPLGIVTAVAEVIVAANDCNKALDALNTSLQSSHGSDWDCPTCCESVPDNFDLCWNCATLHPSLASEETYAMEPEVSEYIV